MKKVLFLLLCLTGICLLSQANGRSFSPSHRDGDSLMVSVPAIEDLFAQILELTGKENDFILREADVLNLEASVSHRKKYISYNPEYIEWINSATRSKWAAMTLLAHELGHHIYKHTVGRKKGKRIDLELQADHFAGTMLYRLGATVDQAKQVMYYIARTEESSTHPGRMARLLAIEKGWEEAAAGTVVASNHKSR